MVSIFRAIRKSRHRLQLLAGNPALEGVLGSELYIFPPHLGTVLPSSAFECMTFGRLTLARAAALASALRSSGEFPGILAGDGELDHLEGNAAAVTDDLGAGLDQLLLQARQRPVLVGSGVASVRRKLPRL